MYFVEISSIPTDNEFGLLFLNSPIELPDIDPQASFGDLLLSLLPSVDSAQSQESFGELILSFLPSIDGVQSYELLGSLTPGFLLNQISIQTSNDFGLLFLSSNFVSSLTAVHGEEYFGDLSSKSTSYLANFYNDENLGELSTNIIPSILGVYNDEYFGDLSLRSISYLSDLYGNEDFGDLSSKSTSYLSDFYSDENLGELSTNIIPSILGAYNDEYFGNFSLKSTSSLSDLHSEEYFGDLIAKYFIPPILGIYSEEYLGELSPNIMPSILGIYNDEYFGDLSFKSTSFLSDLYSEENFGNLYNNFTSSFSGVDSEEHLGVLSPSFIPSISGVYSEEYFGGLSFKYISFLSSLNGEERSGELSPTFILSFPGVHSEEYFGELNLDGLLSIIGLQSSAEFGSLILSVIYNLTDIPTQESLEDSLAVDYFGFMQPISWNVDNKISITSSLVWDVGLGVQKWYRVQGCCIFPTAQGSGAGISGPSYPGGCDVSNFQSNDTSCIGAAGKQRFVQNILATNVADVCRQLNNYNMKWQVCAMQVYSNPAGPSKDACNVLIDVPFSSYPECIEVSVHTNSFIKITYSDYVYFVFVHSGSGGLIASGNASFDVSGPSISILGDSKFNYAGSGGISYGGEAVVDSSWKELIDVQIEFDFYVILVEAMPSMKESVSSLRGVSSMISTVCGACTSMPSTIYTYNNIDKSYVVSRFIDKNSINFPSYFPMYYNYLLKSWTSNYQVSGYGDSGIENWNFVFSWSCLNQKAEEYSSPYWKYSISINRSFSKMSFDTRIIVTFPPQELCRLINNLSIDFSFSLNTLTNYIDNSIIDVTDYVIFSDRIGIFKDAIWTTDPWLDISISRNILNSQNQKIDLSPLLP